MFEVGWSEMLLIAIVMIVVVGPKDLPNMLRTIGRTTAKLRSMAGDFQKQFNEALEEAELGDVKKSVDELRSLNPKEQIRKHLNPFEKAAADVRAGLDTLKPAPPKAAEPEAHSAEPLKAAPAVTPDLPASSAALADAPVAQAAPASMPVAAPKSEPATTAKPAKPAPAKKPASAAKAPAPVKPTPAAKAAPASKTAAKKPAKSAKTAT